MLGSPPLTILASLLLDSGVLYLLYLST